VGQVFTLGPLAEDTARGNSGWRQVRSGNWNSDHKWARSASRGGQYALIRGTGLSFRCAKTLGPR
jgi:hypothetical protein